MKTQIKKTQPSISQVKSTSKLRRSPTLSEQYAIRTRGNSSSYDLYNAQMNKASKTATKFSGKPKRVR